MDFEEFCAAATSVHQLEALDRWEQHARCAYELFEKDGNRAIMIEELASVSCFLPVRQSNYVLNILYLKLLTRKIHILCSTEIEFLNYPFFMLSFQ